MYSADGVKWIKASLTDEVFSDDIFYGAAYGNGVYVAGGGAGRGIILRSTDGGANWTKVNDGEKGYEAGTNDDVCYANCTYALSYIDGRFAAMGLNRLATDSI